MQILTYPFGVLIGTLTVAVDLGTTPPPAVLRLDGRPVCALVEKQSACDVDLGVTPHPHVLDAVRMDATGKIVERAARALNVPGTSVAEARLLPECSPEKQTCVVRFGWLHPQRKALQSAHLTIDGAAKPIPENGLIDVPYEPVRGHLLTIELDFGDDDRTVFSEVVGPMRRAETGVALRAAPVSFDGEPRELERRLRERGRPVQAVERGEAEVSFVVEMSAFAALSSLAARRTDFLSQRLSAPSLVTVVPTSSPVGNTFPRFAASRVQGVDMSGAERSQGWDWLRGLLRNLRGQTHRFPRATDAVAAAGFSLGAAPRRRALVLVLGDERDDSRMTPEAVRAYLKEIAVPLVVLRLDVPRPAWPDATPVTSTAELARALSGVRSLLDGQVVVWAPAETALSDLAP